MSEQRDNDETRVIEIDAVLEHLQQVNEDTVPDNPTATKSTNSSVTRCLMAAASSSETWEAQRRN